MDKKLYSDSTADLKVKIHEVNIQSSDTAAHTLTNKDLITTADAALILGVSTSTLKNWRNRKLFGVPFFTADEKHGDTWYYLRKRVEQLKEVYQPGILGNMYKLARKFKGKTLSDYFQKGDSSDAKTFSLSKIEPCFFPADEVAQILGVSERTIQDWTKNRKFVEDMVDHDGCYWYSAAKVYAMKDKLTPKQNLANLPDELLLLKRFILCGCEIDGVFNPKAPVVKAWTNQKNQHYYNKVERKDKRQLLGFVISGDGKGVDYAVLDFDHVLDDNGNFVNDAAQKWFNYVALSGTFIEKSISGHGLHAIFKPNDGEFEKMASGSRAKLDLGGGACIEIFYKTKGRYFLLTGDVFDCDAKTPISTDCSVIHNLLAEIAKNSTQNKKKNQPKIDSNVNQPHFSANPPEYESARRLAMLNAINPAQLSYSDWLAVISACKNLGISESIVDDWNRRDAARYDEHKNKIQYDSLNDPSFDIETLHGIAKKFGYVEKDFKRQWYKDNPQFADRHLYSNTDFDIKQHFERAGLDYIPLNSFATAENAESRHFITPKDYAVTTAGVFKIDSKGKVKQISKAPICISELYFRNVDDTRLVDIWTRDTDGRILIIDRVDKAVIFDAKKITALSARGLSVTSSTSKDLVDYFADYIDANKKKLKS